VSEVIKEEVRSEENTEIRGTNKENLNEAEISKKMNLLKLYCIYAVNII